MVDNASARSVTQQTVVERQERSLQVRQMQNTGARRTDWTILQWLPTAVVDTVVLDCMVTEMMLVEGYCTSLVLDTEDTAVARCAPAAAFEQLRARRKPGTASFRPAFPGCRMIVVRDSHMRRHSWAESMVALLNFASSPLCLLAVVVAQSDHRAGKTSVVLGL